MGLGAFEEAQERLQCLGEGTRDMYAQERFGVPRWGLDG